MAPVAGGVFATSAGDQASGISTSERVRLMRDAIVNNSALAVSALVGLFLVPLMFHGLGVEAYGLWVGAVSLSGLASAIDLGIPWNLTRRIASARGNAGDVSLHVGSALVMFVTVTVVGVLVVVLVGTAIMGSIAVAGPARELIVPTALMLGVAFLADQGRGVRSGLS